MQLTRVSLLLLFLFTATVVQAAPRPNILFILTEDQGPHMSFLETPGVETPNMDSIATGGVYFREAFVAYPVCSASKAAIFTGDHGPGFQRGKMSLNDLGLRVPLAIRGPGIQSGVVSDSLVSELDLTPTLLDLLDIEPPEVQHGISLRGVLEGTAGAKGHDLIFAEIAHQVQQIDNGMQERSVYDGEYHLIYREGRHKPRTVNADLKDWKPWRNRTYAETVKQKDSFPLGFELLSQVDPQSLGGTPPKFELYNTKNDPDELVNLADNPAYRVQRDRLCNALAKWVEQTNDRAVSVDQLLAGRVNRDE